MNRGEYLLLIICAGVLGPFLLIYILIGLPLKYLATRKH